MARDRAGDNRRGTLHTGHVVIILALIHAIAELILRVAFVTPQLGMPMSIGAALGFTPSATRLV